MAERPRYSRWRRLPKVYRAGEEPRVDPNEELHRVSLYIPWKIIDAAEAQARRQGYGNAQDYCTDLLLEAIEAEKSREQVANVEAKQGPMLGFRAITADPEFLAELSASVSGARPFLAGIDPRVLPEHEPDPALPGAGLFGHEFEPPRPTRVEPQAGADPSEIPSYCHSALVVLRHAGQWGDDPQAFLPSLRRGISVSSTEIAELAQALHDLHQKYRGAGEIDRRLSFALHRLAYESQILHTDAWPGAFDSWTVDIIRAVQESVERILSGQDIRYQTGSSDDRLGRGPRPENLF